jgi:hypothetical protein
MATRRRWLLPVLLLVAVMCSFGCSLLTVPSVLFGGESKQPALIKKLAADDKEVRVVILTSTPLETRPEFLRADRDLANLIARQLREGFKANNEKAKIVSPTKVEEFKNTHPDWKRLDPSEVGGHFNADYVIDVEVNRLSMYEPGSSNLLFRGHAELTVSLVDVNHPDDSPDHRELTITFPGEVTGGAISVDDKPPQVFKAEFYTRVATQVAWQFTAHPVRDDYPCD